MLALSEKPINYDRCFFDLGKISLLKTKQIATIGPISTNN
jgi:hypothetical protein